MKQQFRKRLVSARTSPNAKLQSAVRGLTAEDRAAMRAISESEIFTLKASRGMYFGVRRLRPVTNEEEAEAAGKP